MKVTRLVKNANHNIIEGEFVMIVALHEIFSGKCPETSVENKIRVVVSLLETATQCSKKIY